MPAGGLVRRRRLVRLLRRGTSVGGDPVASLEGGHDRGHVERPGARRLGLAEQLPTGLDDGCRGPDRTGRLRDEAGVQVDVADRGLRREVPRDELGELHRRHGAGHRARVEGALEGLEVEAQGRSEVVRLGERGYRRAQVEVDRELGADARRDLAAAHHLAAHRREKRHDPLDRLAITGDEADQLPAFSGDT